MKHIASQEAHSAVNLQITNLFVPLIIFFLLQSKTVI